MKRRAIIYWLIPAKAERELFRNFIRILAAQFDGPRFEPHLTLVVSAQDGRAGKNILRQIKAAPIRLRIHGIGFSSKFTKTLFVRFNSSRALEQLVVDLAGKRTRLRDPHMSLLYKKIPAAAKKDLASTITLPFREVVFDSIKVMQCASPSRTRADVEAWRAVAKKRLRET